jgi:hypothetical protein
VRDSIFKSTQQMPPKNNSPDVVRTAQTRVEMHENYESAMNIPNKDASVVNVERPRRGHGY